MIPLSALNPARLLRRAAHRFIVSQAENAIMAIYPRRENGVWLFSDRMIGVTNELFVASFSRLIDELVKPKAIGNGPFRMTFSTQPFEGWERRVDFVDGDRTGTRWRLVGQEDLIGWLCPVLFKYIDNIPASMYARADVIDTLPEYAAPFTAGRMNIPVQQPGRSLSGDGMPSRLVDSPRVQPPVVSHQQKLPLRDRMEEILSRLETILGAIEERLDDMEDAAYRLRGGLYGEDDGPGESEDRLLARYWELEDEPDED